MICCPRKNNELSELEFERWIEITAIIYICIETIFNLQASGDVESRVHVILRNYFKHQTCLVFTVL